MAAVLLPLATCWVVSVVRPSVTSETAVLVLVLWVVAAAATGDRIAGVIAAVSGGAWFDFFLTQPYQTFTIDDPDDIEATVLLVVISLAVTEVALWGHRQQAAASRRSGYLDGVVGVASSVAAGDTPRTTVIDVVAREITDVLGANSCRYVDGPIHDVRVAVLDHDGVLTRDGQPVDVERVGMPYNEYVAVPVSRGARVVGHFLVSATSKVVYPSREQLRVAVLLADQVATVFDDESA
jgi:K+-sensing histidine kinase KdpD